MLTMDLYYLRAIGRDRCNPDTLLVSLLPLSLLQSDRLAHLPAPQSRG